MNNEKLYQTENFLINFRYFSKMMHQRFQLYLKKNGVDSCEFICLLLLKREKNGLSMVELTKASKVDKSMTTKVVKKLEEKAYIYRDRDKDNTRNYKICLTKLGLLKASQIEDMLLKERERFENKFTKNEQDLLLSGCSCVLQKFIEIDN